MIPDICILIVGGPSPDRDRAATFLLEAGYKVQCATSDHAIAEIMRSGQQLLCFLFPGPSTSDAVEMLNAFRTEQPSHCFLCAIAERDSDEPDSDLASQCDDLLLRPFVRVELVKRASSGMTILTTRRQLETTRFEIALTGAAADQSEARLEEITQELVEFAADMQIEITHTQTQVAGVRTDTIAQAAVTLRHEINNPLFAVSGTAESVLKRLRIAAATGGSEAETLIPRMERILVGAERIRQVVNAFSSAVTPSTRDYLPGIPMLDLRSDADSLEDPC